MYAVMCHCGLGPSAPPELLAAGEQATQVIRDAAHDVAGPDAAADLTLVAVAIAQGFALLRTDSSLAAGASTARLANHARTTVAALARSAAITSP